MTYWELRTTEIDNLEISAEVNIYWNGAVVSANTTIGEFATNFTAGNGDTYIRGALEDTDTVSTSNQFFNSVMFIEKYKVARVAYGQEPSGAAGSDDDDDSDSNVPDDITEVYSGVANWKAGTLTGVSFWGVYWTGGGSSPTTSNSSAFVWYNGQLTFSDFTGSFSNSDTTSVTGTDGRTYYRGESHPEDGNPYVANTNNYLFYGVGRE